MTPTFDPLSRSRQLDRIMCVPSQNYIAGPTCSARWAESLGLSD